MNIPIPNLPIYKKIFRVTWPTFAELLLSSLFSIVDLVMVSRIGGNMGTASMAAVGLCVQPFQLLVSIFAAVNIGCTTVIAWGIGAGEKGRASHIARQAILFNIGAGSALMCAGILGASPLMRFMGKDETVITLAASYLRIIAVGIPGAAFNMAVAASFRGCGQTRPPLVYNTIGNVLNVAMNYAFIYGKLGFPQMGADGAAWATTVSRYISAAIAAYCVLGWRKTPIKLTVKGNILPDIKALKQIFRIGLPNTFEMIVIQSGLLIYAKMLNTLGVIAYDAHQVLSSVNGMAFSVSQAFMSTNVAMVGQAVGAGDYDKARLHTKLSARFARAATGAIALALIIFSRQISSLVTPERAVIDAAAPLFIFMAAIQFMQSSQMSTSGALRASGDTLFPLLSTAVGIWGFRVGLAAVFIFAFKWGLAGAWAAFAIDQFVRNQIISFRFKSNIWVTKKKGG